MPNTKRLLADHGAFFDDYIVTTSQCCPSRASLLTGQYAHNHGVMSNQPGYPALIDKSNVLPVWLQQAGYYTMHVGKYLNNYERFAEPVLGTRSGLGPVVHPLRVHGVLQLRLRHQRKPGAPRRPSRRQRHPRR